GFKQTKGQFFTPINIVRFILYALELDELGLRRLNNDKELPYITDPACGSGTFLIEAMKMITQEVKYRRRNEVQTNRLVKAKFEELFMPDNHEHRWAREYIYAIEHNFDLGTATKVNMILHGDGSTNTFVKDGLLPFRFYEKGTAPNHLKISQPDDSYDHKEINGQFDVLISNPPFSVNLDNETKRHLKNAFLFHNKRNSENLFLERYYQLLREGGRFGVVLPESVFDTTENKYMRLFLYKYFWIRAVVSIPQLAFQPYTSTKTSLLFAQKKTKGEVKKWNELWSKYSNEYQKLKTRAENYTKVYLKGEEKKKFPSIKDDTDKNIRDNVSRFLKRSLSKEDSSISIKDLLHKHNDELTALCNIDSDTKDIFGFVNTSWVFGEIAKEISYPIFIAEAENIGYKRSKRGEKTQPNELFDLEIAPSKIDVQKVAKQYEQELTDLSAKKASLEDELKKNEKNDKKKVQILARIKNLERQIAEVQQQSARVSAALKKYYDRTGNLLDKYVTRLDAELLGVFQLQRMDAYRSNYVLVRHSDHRTILDFLRKAQAWQ
ncbi:MAG: N-6 DNA methylase, partial [Candidatus Subteraquimicrobiales bacterium]|nr:N-6 DNA methylase [Candidatus Subteraquimicrobiales bacterium]